MNARRGGTGFADGIDAILPDPDNPDAVWLFAGDQYLRHYLADGLRDGWPKLIAQTWTGLRDTAFSRRIDDGRHLDHPHVSILGQGNAAAARLPDEQPTDSGEISRDEDPPPSAATTRYEHAHRVGPGHRPRRTASSPSACRSAVFARQSPSTLILRGPSRTLCTATPVCRPRTGESAVPSHGSLSPGPPATHIHSFLRWCRNDVRRDHPEQSRGCAAPYGGTPERSGGDEEQVLVRLAGHLTAARRLNDPVSGQCRYEHRTGCRSPRAARAPATTSAIASTSSAQRVRT
ncbi:hypothetical protein [Streptomyces sp. NPDC054863]